MSNYGGKNNFKIGDLRGKIAKVGLKSKQKLDVLFDEKVKKIESTERYRTNMALYHDVVQSQSELQEGWQRFLDTANTHLEASFAVQQLLLKFANIHSGQMREEFEAFQKLRSQMLGYQKIFIDTAATEFVTSLSKLDNQLDKLKDIKNICKAEMLETNRLKGKVISMSNSNSGADQIKLRETNLEWQRAEQQYRKDELKFERQLQDFQAGKCLQLLKSISTFLSSCLTKYEAGHKLMQPVTDYVLTDLPANIEDFRNAGIQRRKDRDEEIRKLEMMSTRSASFDDPRAFAAYIQSCVSPEEPELLGGERIMMKTERVINMSSDLQVPGIMYLTPFRLIFHPYRGKKHQKQLTNGDYEAPLCSIGGHFMIPLLSIKRVETNIAGQGRLLTGWCKDLRSFIFSFEHCAESNILQKAYERVNHFVRFSDECFAFSYTPSHDSNSPRTINSGFVDQGWKVYDAPKEFERISLEKSRWRISDFNKDFRLCQTYPQTLVLPNSMDNKSIKSSADFRCKNRLPSLVWKPPKSVCGLYRCSQPKPGISRSRNELDEWMLKVIGASGNGSRQGDLLVLDCRPQKNAIGNLAKGGGYELREHYSNIDLHFANIDNIHAVRGSLKSLHSMFVLGAASGDLPQPPDYLPSQDVSLQQEDMIDLAASSIEYLDQMVSHPRYSNVLSDLRRNGRSKWFKHISNILQASVKAAETLRVKNQSVLVHCSDGWDRTPQVSSLTQLLLDPYFRSFQGFIVLIEKEWATFGHKFAQRFGHDEKSPNPDDTQRSPVFIQFMDCVYQLLVQFPEQFEFNALLLTDLIDAITSCRFGTFLYNNHCTRDCQKVRFKTISLWSFVYSEDIKPFYINADYSPFFQQEEQLTYGCVPLKPDTAAETLELFLPYFIRWDHSVAQPITLVFRDFIPEDPPQDSIIAINKRKDLDQTLRGTRHYELEGTYNNNRRFRQDSEENKESIPSVPINISSSLPSQNFLPSVTSLPPKKMSPTMKGSRIAKDRSPGLGQRKGSRRGMKPPPPAVRRPLSPAGRSFAGYQSQSSSQLPTSSSFTGPPPIPNRNYKANQTPNHLRTQSHF